MLFSERRTAATCSPAPAAVSRFSDAVGERVSPVPGEAEHAHPELPEDVRHARAVPERLHAFHREDQSDGPVVAKRLEVGAALDLEQIRRVLAESAMEGANLLERLAKRSLGQAFERRAHRADLKRHPAGPQRLEPILPERVVVRLPEGQLYEQVVVRVSDSRGERPLHADSSRARGGTPSGSRRGTRRRSAAASPSRRS